jgi:hypothetical protein
MSLARSIRKIASIARWVSVAAIVVVTRASRAAGTRPEGSLA